jgi:hypothetical protein
VDIDSRCRIGCHCLADAKAEEITMGIFGIGSESKSSSSTTNKTVAPSSAASNSSLALSAGGNVNYLSEQALEKSLDFARKAYESQNNNIASVLNSTFDFAKYGVDQANAQAQMTGAAYQSAAGISAPINYSQIIVGGMLLAGVIAYMRMRGRR